MSADTPVALAQNVSAGATSKSGELRHLPLLARACTGPAVLLIGAVFREGVGYPHTLWINMWVNRVSVSPTLCSFV
jgi:hypothetical protein